jgi:hypothetical protein
VDEKIMGQNLIAQARAVLVAAHSTPTARPRVGDVVTPKTGGKCSAVYVSALDILEKRGVPPLFEAATTEDRQKMLSNILSASDILKEGKASGVFHNEANAITELRYFKRWFTALPEYLALQRASREKKRGWQ